MVNKISPTATQRALMRMFREDTGIEAGDTGGATQRAWQLNQQRTDLDFLCAPDAFWDAAHAFAHVDLFGHLSRMLSYDVHNTRRLRRFCATKAMRDEYPLAIAAVWADKEHTPGRRRLDDLSFNHEHPLSQEFGWSLYWTSRTTAKLALCIHGGFDVRGGYTMPRVFDLDVRRTKPTDIARAIVQLRCQSCDSTWSSPNGDAAIGWDPVDAAPAGFVPEQLMGTAEDGHTIVRCRACGEATLVLESRNNI